MKKLLFAFFIMVSASSVFAQNAAKKPEDVIKFAETKYNFGKIKQGVPVTHDFNFTNIGTGAVIIEKATASCGCTTPKWPLEPIAKGGSNKITAGFNAASAGPFTKEIYVQIKGIDQPFPIQITGEVVPADPK